MSQTHVSYLRIKVTSQYWVFHLLYVSRANACSIHFFDINISIILYSSETYSSIISIRHLRQSVGADVSHRTIEPVSVGKLCPGIAEFHKEMLVVRRKLLRYGQQLRVVPDTDINNEQSEIFIKTFFSLKHQIRFVDEGIVVKCREELHLTVRNMIY